MLRILFLILILMSSFAFAQTAEKPQAFQIDEFGRLAECDASARVDNLFISLNNNKNAKAYVIHYRSVNSLPGGFEKPIWALRQLRGSIEFSGQDISRVTFVEGGFRQESVTEFWIVPEGAKSPKPSKTIPKPKPPVGKTFLYDRTVLNSKYSDYLFEKDDLEEYLLPSVKAEREAARKAYEEEFMSENEVEPSADKTEVKEQTQKEIEADKFYWLNSKFAEVIKNKKDLSGVIIFYADDKIYDIGKLQTLIDDGRRKIAKEAEISPAKIQTFFGGYRYSSEVEFWIMPKNGEFPTPTPQERPIESVEDESN